MNSWPLFQKASEREMEDKKQAWDSHHMLSLHKKCDGGVNFMPAYQIIGTEDPSVR